MGYQMVKWGAGVHQWQVTLGQLFNQLYVRSKPRPLRCGMLTVHSVGKRRADHILSAELRGQDGHPHAISPALRAFSQRQ